MAGLSYSLNAKVSLKCRNVVGDSFLEGKGFLVRKECRDFVRVSVNFPLLCTVPEVVNRVTLPATHCSVCWLPVWWVAK